MALLGRQLKRNAPPVGRNRINRIQENISISGEDRKMGQTSHGNATTRTSSRLLVPDMGWPIDDRWPRGVPYCIPGVSLCWTLLHTACRLVPLNPACRGVDTTCVGTYLPR